MASGLQLKPPSGLSFEGNISKNWRDFERAWELFSLASELDKKSEKVQCATFLHVAGAPAQEVYSTFKFEDGESDKIAPLKQKFANYCEPKKNITVNRYTFNSRQQHIGEKFTDYLTSLKTLVKDCEYGPLEDEMLRDRIVCGVQDKDVRMRLLRANNLTLKMSVDTCIVAEMSAEQLKSMNTEVNAMQAHRKKTHPRKSQRPPVRCMNCPYEHDKDKCPEKGKRCRKCGNYDHFSMRCPENRIKPQSAQNSTKPQSNQHKWKPQSAGPRRDCGTSYTVKQLQADYDDAENDDDDEYDSEEQEDFMMSPIVIAEAVTRDWMEKCTINDTVVNFKLDTGAQADILPENIVSLLGINTLNPSKVVLRSYSNHKIKPIGQVKLCVQVGKKAQQVQFQVVDDDVSPILGRETCELLGLVQRGSVNAVDKDVDPVQSEQSKSTSSNVNAQSKVGTDVKVKNVSGVSPKSIKIA